MTSDLELPTASFEATPMELSAPPPLPTRIGRYQVLKELGHGGFGVVYLARDEQLLRQVAVKVPYELSQESMPSSDSWLAEAQIVASLDHPHIVPVYDVGSSPEYPAYIVSKFIDGQSLAAEIRKRPPSLHESLRIVLAMAEALHYAHTRGLVHRDVKPGNIMLDHAGHAYLTDFGLAMRENQMGTGEGRLLGTVQYMSPEQARGEGHLVDGRADIFSLGVVLYELLTGQRPFQGQSPTDIARAVANQDPRPLRQRNINVPRELERICLQAMAKRASERYSTAQDFADDLRQFLAGPGAQLPIHQSGQVPALGAVESLSSRRTNSGSALSAGTMLPVVPKGLRAFDESDREFFLGLLPGPHDREGLPQSLKFWKSRLEDSTSTNLLRIGVVYGPSGCGKSSLVRAGLVPRLASLIRPVIVMASGNGTEARLLEELQPFLNRRAKSLVEAMQQLRRGSSGNQRVLIVFDQFEQWLHANSVSVESELVQALRQCDGEHVACLLIVRDDFWMSVHRLFREFDIRLAERENCAAVDLFDSRHARRVLHAFGHAYGALPERSDELSVEQSEFLDRVITELADDDRVICVRLALFAQMVRNRPWIPATLSAIGGASGVGIRFLEDTFGGSSAPLSYRAYQAGLREMLRALLPAPGTDIKACTRTAEDLAAVAECDVRSEPFRQMLDILENETRLLTPVDASHESEPSSKTDFVSRLTSRAYQLTHDYLVPSIREWLTRKQRESWRGRCELRLEDRAALWSSRPERRYLPSLWETAQITLATKSRNWTTPQTSMMRQAQRLHGWRLLSSVMLCLIVIVGVGAWRYESQRQLKQRMADSVVEQLRVAEIRRVPPLLKELASMRESAVKPLHALAEQSHSTLSGQLRAELALVSSEPQRLASLLELAANADPVTLSVVRDWLMGSQVAIVEPLWSLAKAPEQSAAHRLRLAALLAEFDPQSEAWGELTKSAVKALVEDHEFDPNDWADLLWPAREHLVGELSSQFLEAAEHSTVRSTLARLLAKLGSTEVVSQLLLKSDVADFGTLLRPLLRDRAPAIQNLQAALTETADTSNIDARLRQVRQQRNAGVALAILGREDLLWPLLQWSTDGSLRTELILTLQRFGVPLDVLWRGEETIRDPVARQAIWQSMWSSDRELTSSERAEISRRLTARWPLTIHHAERAGMTWLAQKCELPPLETPKERAVPPAGADWWVNSQGQTLLRITTPVEFTMGSPINEPRRDGNEKPHLRRLERSFAIGVVEVTAEEFRRQRSKFSMDPQVCPTPNCPAVFVSWLDAAKYCRWLSEQENIPEDQMCYPPVNEINDRLVFPPDMLQRTGYRLPTEAEWEYVARSGGSNRYPFGDDDRWVSEFAWWLGNSQERVWPVGQLRPSARGLFDITGNANEWCQDAFEGYGSASSGQPVTSSAAELRGLQNTERVYRGGTYRSAVRPNRVAFRQRYPPQQQVSTMGFRVARTILDTVSGVRSVQSIQH